ncbi:hypothetical protein PTTG_01013 [Puccinia triticina 1-1 BBBD Race 1]|uniref:Uncharacterized protein n=1 Tax=Puccinia triticina (isolate 1-1 / race 1 (BBBD)) TaxID=630390 RepID=A0A180GW55_PUCT1|nr:hypothetical protein PTTG_01013 [Puccinia triticina 1-1 BBBD Race 1]
MSSTATPACPSRHRPSPPQPPAHSASDSWAGASSRPTLHETSPARSPGSRRSSSSTISSGPRPPSGSPPPAGSSPHPSHSPPGHARHTTHEHPTRRHSPWHIRHQSTPRNPIVTIDGLKTRFSVQLSDSECLSEDDEQEEEDSMSQSSGYRPRNYSSTSYSSLSSISSGSTSPPPTSLHDERPLKLSTDSHPRRLQQSHKLLSDHPHQTQQPHPSTSNAQPITPSSPNRRRRAPVLLPDSPRPNPTSATPDFLPGAARKNPPLSPFSSRAAPHHRALSPQMGRPTSAPYPEETDPPRQAEAPRSEKKSSKPRGPCLRESGGLPPVDRIDTQGLSAFIRPIKYGILQLSSNNSPLKSSTLPQHQLVDRLQLRLWLRDPALLDPIPADLIVISPDGSQIELLETERQVDGEAGEEELGRSYESAARRVSFYSLEALPIELRKIYSYLHKFLMIIFAGIPRAVFQLHTPRFHQPVRCAVMMNLPLPDLHFDWLLRRPHSPRDPGPPGWLSLKLKLSRSRRRFKLWINGHLVLDHPIEPSFYASSLFHLDHHFSDHLVHLLRDSFLASKLSLPPSSPGQQDDACLDRFEDFLSFFHPCLLVSNQIEQSLNHHF